MKYNVLNFKYIDLNRIKYSKLERQSEDSEFFVSKCHYNISPEYSIPLIFESPRLKIASNLEETDNLLLGLKIDKNDKSFINFLTQIDKNNINNISNNSVNWFNREIPINAIDSLYSSPLNVSKNGFIFNLKIDLNDSFLLNNIYNSYKEKLVSMI